MNWGIALARAYQLGRRGECRVRVRAEADGAHEDVEVEAPRACVCERASSFLLLARQSLFLPLTVLSLSVGGTSQCSACVLTS